MSRTRRIAGVALAFGWLAACSGGQKAGGTADSGAAAAAAPDPMAVRAAIDSANQQAMAAFNAGTTDAMVANYADDAIVMMPGMKAWTGRAAIDSGVKGMFQAMDAKNFRNTTTDVTVSGDLAVETGTLILDMGPKGGPLATDTLKYLTVWKRQGDGHWKIIRDINNSDIAPKP